MCYYCFAGTMLSNLNIQYTVDHENIFQDLDIAHTNAGIIFAFVWYITHKPVWPKSKCFSGPNAEILPQLLLQDLLLVTPLSLDILMKCGPHFKETSLSFAMLLSLPSMRVPGSTLNSLSRDAQIWTQSLLWTGCRESMCVCVTSYCEAVSKKTKTD